MRAKAGAPILVVSGWRIVVRNSRSRYSVVRRTPSAQDDDSDIRYGRVSRNVRVDSPDASVAYLLTIYLQLIKA